MRRLALLLTLWPGTIAAQTQGWGQLGQQQEKAFSWTDPLWPSFWMAWTPATLLFFVGIFAAMTVLTLLEIRRPGGDERRGVLGLTTTRGDRLFIALLGSAYIFLAWLGIVGQPLWWPTALALAWGTFCFAKV